MAIPVKVVFQGGGAKLVTLMAAASVLRDLEENGEIEITTIVGVSAGSIAACMLASRQDWKLLREYTKAAGSKVIDQVENMPGTCRILWRAYRGTPIFPEQVIREFIREIFSRIELVDSADPTKKSKLERLGQLLIPVSIICASVRHAEKNVYTSAAHTGMRLEDAICDSSAIPFVFRTFNDSSLKVDGGVCGNLPDTEILQEDGNGFVLGFGFEREESANPTSLFRYAMALVDTAMTSAVRDSMARIRSGRGAVCKLPVTFGTFDFKDALDEGLSPETFNSVRATVQREILHTLKHFRHLLKTTENEQAIHAKILKASRQLTAQKPYVVVKSSILVKAQSLLPASDPRYDEYDIITHIVEYQPTNGELLALRLGLSKEAVSNTSAYADYKIETFAGKKLDATQMLVFEERDFNGKLVPCYVAVFFLEHPVAEPVRVVQRTRQKHAMSGLAPRSGREWIRTINPGEHDSSIDLVLFYPAHIGELTTLDMLENIALIQSAENPMDSSRMQNNWARGQRMTAAETETYSPSLSPEGLEKTVGWRSTKVSANEYCGVILQRQ